jgi:probable rRNA maturation factor
VCRIHDRQSVLAVKPAAVRRVVRHTCGREGVVGGEVDVAVLDDAAIAALAGQFGRAPRPTDVLSFSMAEGPEGPLAAQIAVSAETAARQAERRGRGPEGELMLYVVHGLLHQLGYDDADDAGAAAMHAREDALLVELGYGTVYGESSEFGVRSSQ